VAADVPPPRIAATPEQDWWEPGAAVRAFRPDPRRIRGRFPSSHSGSPQRSAHHCCSCRTVTTRRGLLPHKNQTAHAASAGSAEWKYRTSASMWSLVRVELSSSSQSFEKCCMGCRGGAVAGKLEQERVGTWGRPAPSYALPAKSPCQTGPKSSW
jgi:hypothetical protein